MGRFSVRVTLATLLVCTGGLWASEDWPQWGGPNRNFKVDSTGLASSWPNAGPTQLWSRSLGAGHSSIVVDGNVLYTMYRPAGLLYGDSDDEAVIALNANTGKTLWEYRYPAPPDKSQDLQFAEDNLIYCSSAYTGGSRVLKLSQQGGKTTVRELWFTPRMRVHHGTAVRVGNIVYGSSGDFGPAFLAAVDVHTGNLLWQDRSFPKASFVYADGKFIVLDEDGNLALATFSPQGVKVHSKVQVLKNLAWTAPTLVGTRLYLRDRKTIMALELK